jgi:hypothetical protein
MAAAAKILIRTTLVELGLFAVVRRAASRSRWNARKGSLRLARQFNRQTPETSRGGLTIGQHIS